MSKEKDSNPVASLPQAEVRKPQPEKITNVPQQKGSIPVSVRQKVYVGPSRPFGLPLMTNAILRCEPEQLFPSITGLFEAHPAFKRLFVPVPQLAQARKRLGMAGSDMASAHAAITKASADARKK
ncbi:MAG: 50S ribosomal protein L37 [Desulfovibrio sp.]|nr:50S ribosomal protein L37 [Desulfovibrio sp.]